MYLVAEIGRLSATPPPKQFLFAIIQWISPYSGKGFLILTFVNAIDMGIVLG